MYKSYLIKTGLFLAVVACIIVSCKKDKEVTETTPVCKIIVPADSASVQAGVILKMEVSIDGFGGNAEMSFFINGVQTGETNSPPWEYQWETEGWDPGTYRIGAMVADEGISASDEIRIFIIDTIPPLMPPVPVIKITPGQGTTDTIFSFDASGSYDAEDAPGDLLFRWDFDGDGSWDTDFTGDQVFKHKYTHQSNYHVGLQVMDTDSMTADTVKSLLVSPSAIINACQGYVSVYYAGKVYKTVAIGDQCWLRENLDVGEMIPGGENATDNELTEKYCYDDDTANCDQYGGLYTWKELMNYAPFSGSQGICPNGWHIPTDDEWKELEGFSDSMYGVGDETWENILFRGYDAGRHLKSLLGWSDNGNGDNLYDFKAFSGGSWRVNYGFRGLGEEARFWTSTHDPGQNAFHRMLSGDKDNVFRDLNWETAAFSVRCIRD